MVIIAPGTDGCIALTRMRSTTSSFRPAKPSAMTIYQLSNFSEATASSIVLASAGPSKSVTLFLSGPPWRRRRMVGHGAHSARSWLMKTCESRAFAQSHHSATLFCTPPGPATMSARPAPPLPLQDDRARSRWRCPLPRERPDGGSAPRSTTCNAQWRARALPDPCPADLQQHFGNNHHHLRRKQNQRVLRNDLHPAQRPRVPLVHLRDITAKELDLPARRCRSRYGGMAHGLPVPTLQQDAASPRRTRRLTSSTALSCNYRGEAERQLISDPHVFAEGSFRPPAGLVPRRSLASRSPRFVGVLRPPRCASQSPVPPLRPAHHHHAVGYPPRAMPRSCVMKTSAMPSRCWSD